MLSAAKRPCHSERRKKLLLTLEAAVNNAREASRQHAEAHRRLQLAMQDASKAESASRNASEHVRFVHAQLGELAIGMLKS